MPDSDRQSASTTARWLALMVSLSVVLRVGAALYLGNDVTVQPGTADQLSYHLLALRVLGGHGFSFETGWWPATPAGEPTAHWSYLYVLFLAGIYKIVGPAPLVARLVQAIAVGLLQPVLTFAIARRMFGARVGIASAALVAGYAYFIYYAGTLMTESFFILAVLWSLHVAMRLGDGEKSRAGGAAAIPWLTLGVALSAAILLRQAFLVCVPVILLWICGRRVAAALDGPGPGRLSVAPLARGLGLTILSIAIAILPWTVRNYRVFDQFVLLNTNAGFAFFWGNHPVHGRNFIPILPGDGSRYGELIPDDVEDLNEAAADRVLLRRGVGFVFDDPVRYAFLSVSRVWEFMKFWPTPESGHLSNAARVLSFGVCGPFMLAGIVLLGFDRSRRFPRADHWLILSVALVYSLAHVLTWTLVRYRLPVDALLLPLAAWSLLRLFDRLAGRVRRVGEHVLVAG